jgi:cytochrome c oxidase cbb3-type subunit 3
MKYEDKLFDHDYDGIQEFDNILPPWWLNLFYITIIWGVIYFFYYHVFEIGDLQVAEYHAEMQTATGGGGLSGYQSPYAGGSGSAPAPQPGTPAEAGTPAEQPAEGVQPEAAATTASYELVTDKARLENGAKVWTANCLACHGANGEGGIGPNMTDNYWINGDGSFNSMVKVVQDGVPAKGMISWKPVLKEKDLLDVTAHAYNLRGTNPPNAKEPQGTQYGE